MSVQTEKPQLKRRVHHFAAMKQKGEKITVVTAYDYPTALAAENGGADIVLVGDSLGMVALGFESTIPVTVDMMVHHTAAVRRGVKNGFLVADMPFMSYHVTRELTLQNVGRLIQEAGAEAVKLEGGQEVADVIRAVTNAGIPVMAHVGLLPQSVHKLGGYRVQGREGAAAAKLVEDALAVQEAGAFAVVVEAMDADTAGQITTRLAVPTIGIGAGRQCDGQVLVLTDLIGMLPGSSPKFVKKYSDVSATMTEAVERFRNDVRSGDFPEEKHEY